MTATTQHTPGAMLNAVGVTADKDGRALVLGSSPSNEGTKPTIVLR